MAFNKDSLIIEVSAAADGYTYRLWRWRTSPPPVPFRDLDGSMNRSDSSREPGQPPAHLFGIAATKNELKSELGTLIDNQFDV